jgi:hypothetical protein
MNAKARFVWRWLCALLIGGFLGLITGAVTSVVLYFVELQLHFWLMSNPEISFFLGIFAVIIVLMVMGATIGYVQWRLVLHHIFPKWHWTMASIMSVFVAIITLWVLEGFFRLQIIESSTSAASGMAITYGQSK